MVWVRAMIWFWLGFFTLVALLLVLDLGVLHRKAAEPSLKSAAWWTVAWVCLGLSFAGAVYLIYEMGRLDMQADHGSDAAIPCVSAYLLEQARAIDNIFVMSLLFRSF